LEGRCGEEAVRKPTTESVALGPRHQADRTAHKEWGELSDPGFGQPADGVDLKRVVESAEIICIREHDRNHRGPREITATKGWIPEAPFRHGKPESFPVVERRQRERLGKWELVKEGAGRGGGGRCENNRSRAKRAEGGRKKR
jgi:hypothetical protein